MMTFVLIRVRWNEVKCTFFKLSFRWMFTVELKKQHKTWNGSWSILHHISMSADPRGELCAVQFALLLHVVSLSSPSSIHEFSKFYHFYFTLNILRKWYECRVYVMGWVNSNFNSSAHISFMIIQMRWSRTQTIRHRFTFDVLLPLSKKILWKVFKEIPINELLHKLKAVEVLRRNNPTFLSSPWKLN